MSRSVAPEIELIQAPLRRAVARLRLQGLLDAGLVGGAVGAGAFVLASLERRVMRTGLLPGSDWPGDLAASAAVAVLAAIALALWRLSNLPEIREMARLADRRFELDERVSTTIGLTQAGQEGAVLRRALVADALAHLPRVLPALLAPFRPSALWLALPVLAALGLALVVLVPDPPAAPDTARRVETPLDTADRRVTAEDLVRVADLMREQAEVRDDAYMDAVARTLDALARRLESDPGMTRSEAVAELAALSAETRAAAEGWRGQAGARLADMVAALSERLAEPPPSGEPAAGDIPDAMAAGLNGEPSAPGAPGSTRSSAGPRDGLDEMMESFAQGQGQPAGAAAPGDLPNPVVRGSFYNAPRGEGELAPEPLGAASEAAQLMGPSARSAAGESILAGEGTDALDKDAAEAVAVNFETSADFVLEAKVHGEGRQMLRELPPEAVLSPVADFDLAEARNAWRERTPAAAWRDVIAPARRAALQSYFLTRAAQVTR